MNIEIDKRSGFCFGVVYAIQKAENELMDKEKLYCLGDIVHNSEEVKRLEDKGLITINHDEFKNLTNSKVLIRAHGEPPETYKTALKNNIKLIDASCPVVLKLQNKIKTGFDKTENKNGQIIIFGKKGHAEVNGLVGQTNGNAIVISKLEDLENIDFNKPVNIFSQTTKSLKKYAEIIEEIKKRAISTVGEKNIDFISNDSICRQVSNRYEELEHFSKEKDVIIFVSGKKSSNGKVLYQVCKTHNDRSFFVSNINEINFDCIKKTDSVGICGATSSPLWLMENVKKHIENYFSTATTF